MHSKARTLNPPVKTNPAEAHRASVAAILSNPENHKRWQARPVREPAKPKAKKVDVNKQTADWVRAQGMHCSRVDYWDGIRKLSHDLLGIFDQLALGNGETWGIQTTTKHNMGARRSKILDSTGYQWAKAAGWKVCVIGWFKNKSDKWEAAVEWL